MKNKIFTTIIIGTLMSLMLVGCGATKTLESYYSKPLNAVQLQSQLDDFLDTAEGAYFSDVSMDFSENTMYYDYTYKTEPVISSDEFYSQAYDSLKTNMDSLYSSIRTESGIPSDSKITIVYRYYNPDGSLFCELAYPEQ